MKANYVLWCDGLDFYVSKRVGVKRDSELRDHFVEFFETEQAAYRYAEHRTRQRIDMLNSYIRRYKREMRKTKSKGVI
jgi:hypothetical protein